MERLLQDMRYGFRMLLRKPGFTAVAVLTLALGIGANTAIFSVVNGVLLRPLPYKDTDRILTLWEYDTKSGKKEDGVAPANFLDWRDQQSVFERMAMAEPYSFRFTGSGEPESFRSWLVSEGFFEILGTDALYGRVFQPEEYEAGNNRVVVMGEALWRRRFGADPNLVGQSLLFNGQPHKVVGIMPSKFQFPSGRMLWAPMVIRDSYKQDRRSAYIKVIGRLKPGLTLKQAEQEMTALQSRLAEQYPKDNGERGALVIPLAEQSRAQVRPALLLLLGAAGFVLLIACANVANLLLARGAERGKEFAIRSALGAVRSRLVRQLITESISLALLGGVGGILMAWWGVDLILAFSAGILPANTEIGFDSRVLVFALAVSVLTALVFGVAPSLQFSKPDLQESLKEGGRTSGGGAARPRFRNALVVTEIALALTLLVGAGLLVRSFVRLLQVDPGFTADKALSLEVHVWGSSRTPQQRAAFFEQTLDRIASLPGVESAGAVSALPFHDNSIDINGTFTIEGRPAPPGGQEPSAYFTIATTDYFTAMGIPLRSGRLFTRFDREGAPPVVLIGETMARRFWPDEDPVGKKIRLAFLGEAEVREVIGVVGDTRHEGLDSDPRTEIFLPHLQEPYGSMTYLIRTASEPSSLVQGVKNAVWAVNKDLPFSSIATVDELVSRSLGERRFNLLLLGSFALIALTLASIGIYGLISFSISRRTHEIGVRMAMGAQTGDIMKLVLKEGMALALAGVGIGVGASIALTRLLASLLYGVSTTDVFTYVAVSLLLTGVALGACYVPARRATKVDPMVALRYE
ncbi:MAG TPA: ABC transporter permease [Blastocatellia bacterium]|nr:ABC transporter permease [Blastocatellia bacterium]